MNLLFLLLLAAAAFFLQRRSAARGAENIEYHFSSDRHLVGCGEEFCLSSALVNHRRLPVLFLHLTEELPREMMVQTGDSGAVLQEREQFDSGIVRRVEQTFYLMPRQKLTRTLTATLSARGCYRFRPSILKTGDLLGLEEYELPLQRSCEIVVYPEKADLPAFDQAFGNWYGDISVQRFILPDPILTIGFHEYSGREPMKDISWPRTLRSGKMMVKEYDHTSEPAVTVMLNTSKAGRETSEACFRAMRTVCEKLETEGIAYSIVSNTATPGGISSRLMVNDGIGRLHLLNVLEGLGRASATAGADFPHLLRACRSRDYSDRGFLLVTPPLSPENRSALRSFEKQTGKIVLCVEVRGGDAP